jgi:endonuclease/exonuclease/phosphatase family metal-dependent hydrolase
VKRRKAVAEQEVAALTAKLQKPGISDSLKASTTKKLVSARETVGNLDDMLADKAKRQAYYDEWKTYQISDHLPLFVELNVDFSRRYLQSFITAPVV